MKDQFLIALSWGIIIALILTFWIWGVGEWIVKPIVFDLIKELQG